jgi:hypothetical protein
MPEDPVTELHYRLSRGELKLEAGSDNGFLKDVLNALNIDIESQVLVFSRTSLNTGLVRANNPRAIYFNDETYVAWVPGSDSLEIASMDPNLGPVFYLLKRDQPDNTGLVRHAGQCLRCHDSYTLSGGGVPRFILGSGYTYFTGSLVSHEGWILTDQETPLKFRWGGWYVTGVHGDQVHLGNIVVKQAEELQDLESIRNGNLMNIADYINPDNYLTDYSDIDALMVMEHQVHIQNLMTRVNYDVRKKLFEIASRNGPDNSDMSETDLSRIHAIIDPLISAMFMTNEGDINDTIEGNAGFREKFEARGPFDSQGRSLRELDLETRLFKYPLSYLIYSPAFDGLPELAREYVYQSIGRILSGQGVNQEYSHLSREDRIAIEEILLETHREFSQIRR